MCYIVQPGPNDWTRFTPVLICCKTSRNQLALLMLIRTVHLQHPCDCTADAAAAAVKAAGLLDAAAVKSAVAGRHVLQPT